MPNKKKVAIVTDGACSFTPAQAEQYGLAVAPVYVNFGEQTYQSGVNLDAAEFYQLLRSSKNLPTTAQPTNCTGLYKLVHSSGKGCG